MAKTDNEPQNDPDSTRKLLDTQKSIDAEELKRTLNEMPLTDDTTCGIWCFKGSFLQK